MTEADAQELAWHRDWRKRLLSAMRLWWIGPLYKDRCRGWSMVSRICKEQPPKEGSEE